MRRVVAAAIAAHVMVLGLVLTAQPRSPIEIGKQIFRYDTFGDEQLWTGVLRMQEAVAGLDPLTALAVGLKVDVGALPAEVIAALKNNELDLADPAITQALLRLNAVVGVQGTFDDAGQLASVGITCALCHSTVDDSFTDGIGTRLDGYANIDLDVGKIVSLSPALPETLKAEFRAWGPGKYDPRHHYFDGFDIVLLHPEKPSTPIVIPPIYGLRGVGFETFTGDGPISYWNSYVGVGQMGGKGNFSDPRVGITIAQTPDLVTPKLPALLQYQLSLRTPAPPAGSFDPVAAGRGRAVFYNQARCASCHAGANYTDVMNLPALQMPLLHDPSELAIESEYVSRSATKQLRTTPLRGLWQHPPYFHDGSARTLLDVVNRYDRVLGLGLTEQQKADLVEFLKTL